MTRIAVIEKGKCNPLKCGNYLCIRLCPVNKTGGECIIESPDKKVEIMENTCTGCNICCKKCPFEAIHIINLPEKLKEDPIHRFSKNSFELFNLPTPKKNTVIGIIGRNGIGKTTALSILAGAIKPNLGNYKISPEDNIILHKYSTKEIGEYLKKLFKKELKISYKPQRVELLVELYQEKTIKELLKKVDEKNIIKELIKDLDMENLLDRRIEELSGGELQRLAIIATASKKADLYYFDEPSSFCDITQRIKIAKLIRSLKTPKTSIIVIEHDLATLDYISDEINIVYGEHACYGIFSQSKSVRRGINEYLDGYLPDENIKFRNYSINFQESNAERSLKTDPLLIFPKLKKTFPSFKLEINSIEIRKNEVLTIMGANGLGKTTFLKLISKELEDDEKTKLSDLRIIFKHQYLDNNIEKTVEEFLKENASQEYSSGWYKTNILEKLNIKTILKNKIKYLSGGELQKVHIAKALSQECDLILMDEPSAFIDIEDRLNVAEVIKEFTIKKEIATIVVDHDIQFIDYISDALILFTGEPGKNGKIEGPLNKTEGMNKILKILDITYRKDKETKRPRINKPESQLDKEQRAKNKFYY
ncbi:ribosome biogenesis/translation initiation ATPase RLI [Candidatus Woesearchaeota archaeon]|nr:ribosome biogenesis/translation initiation ATPase RLI [Candidatus Woesearchaeota archaeon]